ncbi:hypothetical protein [Paludisphaera rhizosphaerae]|uniref:hypothetical protein n=1 Tax=Paludisphaera rhizosphaerae TaxID=2711216 RepID=UPI0013E9A0AA|nr:hypothetical protein [Paludisphaera rhizosphaerae]
MKPIFVQVRNGEKDVRWLPLFGFAVLLIVAGAAICEALAYVVTGDVVVAAAILGAIVGLFLAVRQIIATIAYQPIVLPESEDVEHDVLAS